MQSQSPRSSFPHGSDCVVTFVGRADNKKACVDVWSIVVGELTYTFQTMRMKESNGRWVFGSFKQGGEQRWQFRDDVRKQAGFRGASFTVAFKGTTYVLFENQSGVRHVLPFVDFLADPIRVTEVIDDLRQAIIVSHRYSQQPAPEAVVDFRQPAKLQSERVVPEYERARKSFTHAITGSDSVVVSNLRPGQDSDHKWFFANVLHQMCTKQP